MNRLMINTRDERYGYLALSEFSPICVLGES